MGLNSLAKSLFGKSNTQNNINSQSRTTSGVSTITGIARTDSVDGIVSVDINGTIVDVVTEIDVRKGDTVTIRTSNHSLAASGVVGGGDRTKASVNLASQKAEQASQMAEITNNYFFHDTDGAHVTETEGTLTGRHVTIHANGMFICDYDGEETIESSFTNQQAQIGRDDQSHLILRSQILGFEPGNDTDGAIFTVDTNRSTTGSTTYDKAIIAANTFNQIDTVATYAALEAYSITSSTANGSVIKVTADETHSGNTTYYSLHKTSTTTGYWSYLGTDGVADYSHLELQAGTKATIVLNDATTPETASTDAQIEFICQSGDTNKENVCVTMTEHGIDVWHEYWDGSAWKDKPLVNPFMWNLIATTTGSASASIDIGGYSEVMVICHPQSIQISSGVFPVSLIQDGKTNLFLTGGAYPGYVKECNCICTQSTFRGNTCLWDEQDMLAQAHWYLYAR